MISVDTSAWVEFHRATGSVVDLRVAELIDVRKDELRRLLLRFDLHSVAPFSDFEAAARIYRRCRRVGSTPRGLVDCVIAAVAWRRDGSLLAQGRGVASRLRCATA